MENKRESNIELLRIISMILIVAYHCTLSTGYLVENKGISIILITTGMWGILGVDCFLIISFNFLYNSEFKISKLLNIIKEVVFYSCLFIIIVTLIKKIETNNSLFEIVSDIFVNGLKQPFWNDVYWFATIYILMYVSFPILNKILKSLNEKDLKYTVIILTVIIFMYQMKENVIEDYFFCIYMYIAFFYFKFYKETWIKENCKSFFIICTLFLVFLKIISETSENNLFLLNRITGDFGRHSILFFIDSVFLFYIFKEFNIKNSKIINLIATTTFGIYLFHENQIFSVRCYIYKLADKSFFDGYKILLFYLMEIVIIFVMGMAVDFIRQILYKLCKKNNVKLKNSQCKKLKEGLN